MNFIEPLESRIAPAVTSSFAAGILSIGGDNGDNTVTITELATPGSYHVDGLAAGETTDFTSVISIAANLRDGVDALIFNGDVTVGTALSKDLSVTARGALTVTVNANVNIKGIMDIQHGGGPGTPALTATIQGAGTTVGQLVIHDGQGDSTLNFGAGARVLKTVVVDGGGGNGNDAAHFDDALIGGAITKTDFGKGSDQLTINNSRVGGAVTFIANSDSPNFSIQTNSAVKGPVNVTYTGGGTSSVTLAGSLGNVNVTAGGGNDGVTFGNANVFGKVTLKLGDGANSVTHGSSQTSGNVSITGGTGATTVTVDAVSQIYGSLSVAAPLSSSLSVTLNMATIGGKLTMLAGTGGDNLVATSSTVTGGITATLGAGTNSVTIDTISSFAGVTITAGADADIVTATNLALRGTLSATLGDGANSVSVRGSVGGVKLKTGIGSDTFELRNLFVRGATAITAGLGDDLVRIADGLFGAAFAFNAGDGSNTFDVEHLLADNDGVGTLFLGALTYKGGLNNDTVFLGLDANDAAITMAAAKFTGGLGTNTLNDNFLIALSTFAAPGFTIV